MRRKKALILFVLALCNLLIAFYGFNVQAKTVSKKSKPAPVKIVKVVDIMGNCKQYDIYTLPATVNAYLSNKTTKKVAIKWNTKSVNTFNSGTYKFAGSISGYSKKINLILKIKPISDEQIKSSSIYSFDMKDNSGEQYQVYLFSSNLKKVITNSNMIWAGASKGDVLYTGNYLVAYKKLSEDKLKVQRINGTYGNNFTINYSRNMVFIKEPPKGTNGNFLFISQTEFSNLSSASVYYIENGILRAVQFQDNNKKKWNYINLFNGYKPLVKINDEGNYETFIYDNYQTFDYYVYTWNWDSTSKSFVEMENYEMSANEFQEYIK